jgi:translation initiation factor RLI1
LSHGFSVIVLERILAPIPADAAFANLDSDSLMVFMSEPATNLTHWISPATQTVFNADQVPALLQEMEAIARRPQTSRRVRLNLEELVAYIERERGSRHEYFVVFLGN